MYHSIVIVTLFALRSCGSGVCLLAWDFAVGPGAETDTDTDTDRCTIAIVHRASCIVRSSTSYIYRPVDVLLATVIITVERTLNVER